MKKSTIGSKYHIEGSRIVKTSNDTLIPKDEPLILFRARDRLSLKALEAYRTACLDDHCAAHHKHTLDLAIRDFRKYQLDHPEKMKQPGGN